MVDRRGLIENRNQKIVGVLRRLGPSHLNEEGHLELEFPLRRDLGHDAILNAIALSDVR